MPSLLSPRMARVGASSTAAISDRMRALSALGRSVINLGEGELDFDTPEHICDAAVAAIRGGETKYTAISGTQALKQAIRHKFARENGVEVALDQIIAGTGAKQLIFNAFLATLGEGDEVIIPAPYWVSYPEIVRIAGGTPVIVPTQAAQGWKLAPEALRAALTPRTRWIVLNNPNNPTGALYSAAELAALEEVLAPHQALLLADDIYEHIVYDLPFVAPAQAMRRLADRILTVNGVSKAYSMTGWRLGYATGPKWLIDAMEVLQSQSTSNPSSISQAAAVAALEVPATFLEEWRRILRRRRDLVVTAIAAMPGLGCDTPPAAFYVFAGCEGLFGRRTPEGARLETDVDVAGYLIEEAGVGLVPGTAFGAPGHLRIAYGIDEAHHAEAMARIAAAVERLAP